MPVRLPALSEEELTFIRSRGTQFGKGCAWQIKAEAAEAFEDGWALVENGLRAKGLSHKSARKAARIFTRAAWREWYRNKSFWRRLVTRLRFG